MGAERRSVCGKNAEPGAEAACLFYGTPGMSHAKRYADKGVANEGWDHQNRQPRSDWLCNCRSVTQYTVYRLQNGTAAVLKRAQRKMSAMMDILRFTNIAIAKSARASARGRKMNVPSAAKPHTLSAQNR